jgi:hypothetical protein
MKLTLPKLRFFSLPLRGLLGSTGNNPARTPLPPVPITVVLPPKKEG